MIKISFAAVALFLFSFAFAGEGLTVVKKSGHVRYNQKEVKVGEFLPLGGVIEVGSTDESFVDLTYPEGHRLRLKKNTKVNLIALGTKNASQIDIAIGQVFAYFLKDKKAENIQIKTKSAVVGVRGTKFLVEANEEKGTYVCVCEGVVNVRGVGGHAKDGERIVKANQDLWARPGKSMGTPVDSPDMSKMTSAEFADMGVQ